MVQEVGKMSREVTREEVARMVAYNNPAKMLVTGIVIGAAVGGVLALLYAPKKGSETREFIREKAEDATHLAKRTAEDVRVKAGRVAEDVRITAAETRQRGEAELQALKRPNP